MAREGRRGRCSTCFDRLEAMWERRCGKRGRCAAAIVLAGVSCAAAPSSAIAGHVYRVAVTDEDVEAVAVGGGRVFWTTWDGNVVSLHSSYPAGDLRRLLRVDVSQFDWAFPALWSSRERVVVQVDYTYSDPDAEYSGTVVQASGPVDARRAAAFGPSSRDERIHDVDGHRVATTTVRASTNRRTVRAFIRDLARPQTPPRAVGPVITRAVGRSGADPEVRIAGRYVAVLQDGRPPTITVFDQYVDRAHWTVRLPRWRGSPGSAPSARAVMWDLARSGTVAAALDTRATGPSARRQELGVALPYRRFQRITRRVALRQPLVIDGHTLTYARPSRPDWIRVAQRALGQANPHFLSGEIPSEAPVASDGQSVAAVITTDDRQGCVLAARGPFASAGRWRC